MVKLDPNTLMLQLKNMFCWERKMENCCYSWSVEHPMTKEHYIEWIAVVSDNGIEE